MYKLFGKTLIIGAHGDDVELGCGGLLNNANKFDPFVVLVTNKNDRKHEFIQSMDFWGISKFEAWDFIDAECASENHIIREKIYKLNVEHKFDTVICHDPISYHQDHSVLSKITFQIFHYSSVLGYISERANVNYKPNLFIEITEDDINKKIESLSFYKTEYKKDFASKEYLFALHRTYGIQINKKYAEAFCIHKLGVSNVIYNNNSCRE